MPSSIFFKAKHSMKKRLGSIWIAKARTGSSYISTIGVRAKNPKMAQMKIQKELFRKSVFSGISRVKGT